MVEPAELWVWSEGRPKLVPVGGARPGYVIADQSPEFIQAKIAEADALDASLAEARPILQSAMAYLDDASDPLIRAILALHQRFDSYGRHWLCGECTSDGAPITWPCPTVRIIAEHLDLPLPDDDLLWSIRTELEERPHAN